MGPQAAARAVVLIAAAALVFAAAGFGGYAVYRGFEPVMGPAAAAAVTAVIAFAIPLLGIVFTALRRNASHAETGDNTTLGALAAVAKDKPLLAVLLSGVVGLASALNSDKK